MSCENGSAVDPGGVQDGDRVLHDRLERPDVPRSTAFRASGSSRVHHDELPRSSEPAEEARHRRVVPVQFDVRRPALQIEERRRPVAERLVGERNIASPREPRLWSVHERILCASPSDAQAAREGRGCAPRLETPLLQAVPVSAPFPRPIPKDRRAVARRASRAKLRLFKRFSPLWPNRPAAGLIYLKEVPAPWPRENVRFAGTLLEARRAR
jgi:hypothetical protein